MSDIRFAVIGGDIRSIKLANFIAADGYKVNIYGFNNASFDLGLSESPDYGSAIAGAKIILGPVPFSNDNETVNAPFHQGKIYINEILQVMSKDQILIAGRVTEKVAQLARVYNVNVIDILEREDMAVLNAIPTAEGAIQIAMEEMPTTLHNSNVMVLGFGRIGKILAKMLDGIGARVYVEARKYSDIAWIKSYGYTPLLIGELEKYVGDMNIIFNTIPYKVLDSNILDVINKDCLIIDLASKPGGVDFDRAKSLGLKAIWALSLPGKVAPVTAAKYIKETVFNIISELGV
jgi:dipicolinate synthase subunit A